MSLKLIVNRLLCWLGWHWGRWTKDRFGIYFCRSCGLIRRKDGTIIRRVNPGEEHWVHPEGWKMTRRK